MTRPIPPGSTIGILGSGQLGRMLALAARNLGYSIAIFSPEADAPAASVASGAGVQPKTVEPELEAKRRKAEQDQAARAKSEAKAEEERVAAMRTENCNRARADVRTLDDGGRLARSNARGEREVLDDRQRAEELRRTRDLIAALCR